jgi:folate-dependent tRNA-U54 methylase TrmFO/GidA
LEAETEGDYSNCPMTRDEYYHFVDELINETINLGEFERYPDRRQGNT